MGLGLSSPLYRFVEPQKEFDVRAGDHDLVLVLERAEPGICTLTIRVVDAQDGSPLALDRGGLSPTKPDPILRAGRPTVKIHEVLVDDVPPGRWTFSAFSKSHGEIEHALEVPHGVTTHLVTVEVPRVGTIRGRIEWERGSPEPVTVTLGRPVLLGDAPRGYFRLTPGEGFVLRAPPGPLRLTLDGGFAYGDAVIDVVSGEDREIVIRGGRGGQLKMSGLAKMGPASAALFVQTGEGPWRCVSVHRQRITPWPGGFSLTKGVAPGNGRWRVTRMADAKPGSDPATWPTLAEGDWSVAEGGVVQLQIP